MYETTLNILDHLANQALAVFTASSNGYYDGNRFFEPAIIFAVRSIATAAGLGCLVVLDLSTVDATTGSTALLDRLGADSPNERVRVGPYVVVGLAASFLFVHIAADAVFLGTRLVNSPRMLAKLLAIGYLLRVGIYVVMLALDLTGYASTCILLLTYLSFDLRDSKAHWTAPSSHANGTNRRNSINSAITVTIIVFTIVLSVIGGLAVDFIRDKRINGPITEATIANVFPSSSATLRTSLIPACNAHFGRASFGNGNATVALTPLSMSTLAFAAYGANETDVNARARANPVLREAGVRVHNSSLAVSGAGGAPKSDNGVRYYEFRFAAAPETSVVAVRGTASIGDALQDAYIWATPSLIKMSSSLGSLASVWPARLTAWFVKFITDNVAFTGILYYEPVTDLVADLVARNRTVVMAGHSLGGGIAQIVAAKKGVPAMALSSPGLGLSYLNYNVTADAIARWSFNVVPFKDPVPMLDSQISTLMHIPCDQELPPEFHWSPGSFLSGIVGLIYVLALYTSVELFLKKRSTYYAILGAVAVGRLFVFISSLVAANAASVGDAFAIEVGRLMVIVEWACGVTFVTLNARRLYMTCYSRYRRLVQVLVVGAVVAASLHASLIWGAVGPKRFFFESSYAPVIYVGLALGISLPIVLRLCYLFVGGPIPWQLIYAPILLSPQGPSGNQAHHFTGFVVSFIFQFFIYRYRSTWWKKYNYVLATALDVGSALSTIFITLAFEGRHIEFPAWLLNCTDSSEPCGRGDWCAITV
ncbi:hypothetical protein H9P43_004585 [Blastocladiella emersonii ATCC 22665]|nr:hypothetical protein H9P43_004585 [Blastocladiella emersonii ATCC 22665]